jgi:hypothetical protein
MTSRPRKQLALILIVLLFAAPFVTAYVLNKAGWRPPATRNYGELVTPPQDLGAAKFILADGKPLQWKDAQWSWTIFAIPGPDCATQCIAAIDELRRVRLTMNDSAERVRVVVLDTPLPPTALARLNPVESARDASGALGRLRPGPGQVAVAIAGPRGFLVMRYAPGYDANRMRKDLARLLKT